MSALFDGGFNSGESANSSPNTPQFYRSVYADAASIRGEYDFQSCFGLLSRTVYVANTDWDSELIAETDVHIV